MNPEEGQNLTTADHVQSLLQSDGWKYVYSRLTDKLMDLQNIRNLDMSKPDTYNHQILARTMAVDLIMAWLKADVFGFVEQQKAGVTKLLEKAEAYISRE